jgi:crossover junction endodeoxyribonuclease RuvC
MSDTILGIDVGLDGALAFYRGGVWTLIDMPTIGKKKRELDCATVCALLREHGPIAHAYIEHAAAMRIKGRPQGGSSMFSFGRTFGALQMALSALGIPQTVVTAQTWKKAAGIPSGADKEAGRRRALHLFPGEAANLARKKDHARSDAMLIAYFGAKASAT